eukprot:TRINITY_DN24262_c0_g1_i2.p1 TRINITY_DN24262_c0_g1~~TRINITY_DN24262_c0_g1_i2.p1  ORF type:complete len:253 (+),score=69.30 TRINITY_DN24262_c0_g1_i2:96-854(+)
MLIYYSKSLSVNQRIDKCILSFAFLYEVQRAAPVQPGTPCIPNLNGAGGSSHPQQEESPPKPLRPLPVGDPPKPQRHVPLQQEEQREQQLLELQKQVDAAQKSTSSSRSQPSVITSSCPWASDKTDPIFNGDPWAAAATGKSGSAGASPSGSKQNKWPDAAPTATAATTTPTSTSSSTVGAAATAIVKTSSSSSEARKSPTAASVDNCHPAASKTPTDEDGAWEAYIDPNSGKEWWWNAVTGKASWTRPAGF